MLSCIVIYYAAVDARHFDAPALTSTLLPHDSPSARTFTTPAAELGVKCLHGESCTFYSDVLLVVKLNPTRILWADALLQFYGTGFQHIVFFSALKRNDTSRHKYLRVGAYNIEVHLLDDNYGFCDHETVARASEWWPDFAGYLFLSDDVLFEFWKLFGASKHSVWKQNPQWRPESLMTASERRAVAQLEREHPSLLSRIRRKGQDAFVYPFAATSGVYFVPTAAVRTFRLVSSTLMAHRTYNEWGTPIALLGAQSASAEEHVTLKGRLIWGKKRLQALRTMLQSHHTWYHPVRASSETFARMLHWIRSAENVRKDSLISAKVLFASCFVCATHRPELILKKGLYHSCKAAESAETGALCRSERGRAEDNWDLTTRDNMAMTAPKLSTGGLSMIGGNVHVPRTWIGVANPLEVDHEGFWGKDVTDYVFRTYYPMLNRSHIAGLGRYPQCCVL